MTRYLEDYARSHEYAGSTLEARILFNTRVKTVKKTEEHLWHVELVGGGDLARFLRARKIIDASGITTEPELPNIANLSLFNGTQTHMKNLASSDLFTNTTCNRVVVIGGAKSAADACYSAARAGKTVYWIIRKSGNGPCFFAPAQASPPFKAPDEPLLTRILFYILSSHFVEDTFFVRLLNRTAIGRSVIRFLWRLIERDFRKAANYDRPDPKGNGFKNLEPDTPLFWANDNTGVEQRDDFFDVIAENVKIFREDIAHMEADAVVLADGTRIAADALIYGTGWKQTLGHYDPQTSLSLGLPVPLRLGPAATVDCHKWDALEFAAEKTVLNRFPILAHPPRFFKKEPKTTPYRLYQTIVPISDSSIVFVGRMSFVNSWRVAEVQSLWAVAALDGRIQALQSKAAVEKDVAETVVWCRRRYLNKGDIANWFLWDCVAYTDCLLRELGLKSHLGKEGLLSPCRAKSLGAWGVDGGVRTYEKRFEVAVAQP
ncbi:hypothetical protein HMPREF1624_07978 [Sporothrix schenckii ATCC 58251]|uniref:L-ornithine N(5)-oxygenase n=1 Tax=Sporothrix schenckii (strain ATCC 58251 / de Perez 2211183) TaxID=1391915 RepID=U7PIW3_SPOS1|nr:hypothetical protein HMPREF1624_07978 [Sporothrix schenckii ATCC 58251]